MHRILKYSNSAEEQKYRVNSSSTLSPAPLPRDSHCQYSLFLVLLVIIITLYNILRDLLFDVFTLDRAVIS